METYRTQIESCTRELGDEGERNAHALRDRARCFCYFESQIGRGDNPCHLSESKGEVGWIKGMVTLTLFKEIE